MLTPWWIHEQASSFECHVSTENLVLTLDSYWNLIALSIVDLFIFGSLQQCCAWFRVPSAVLVSIFLVAVKPWPLFETRNGRSIRSTFMKMCSAKCHPNHSIFYNVCLELFYSGTNGSFRQCRRHAFYNCIWMCPLQTTPQPRFAQGSSSSTRFNLRGSMSWINIASNTDYKTRLKWLRMIQSYGQKASIVNVKMTIKWTQYVTYSLVQQSK